MTESVIAGLGLKSGDGGTMMSHEELLQKISVSTPSDTRVVQISARDSDPYRAADIADAVREAAAFRIGEVMTGTDRTGGGSREHTAAARAAGRPEKRAVRRTGGSRSSCSGCRSPVPDRRYDPFFRGCGKISAAWHAGSDPADTGERTSESGKEANAPPSVREGRRSGMSMEKGGAPAAREMKKRGKGNPFRCRSGKRSRTIRPARPSKLSVQICSSAAGRKK